MLVSRVIVIVVIYDGCGCCSVENSMRVNEIIVMSMLIVLGV